MWLTGFYLFFVCLADLLLLFWFWFFWFWFGLVLLLDYVFVEEGARAEAGSQETVR